MALPSADQIQDASDKAERLNVFGVPVASLNATQLKAVLWWLAFSNRIDRYGEKMTAITQSLEDTVRQIEADGLVVTITRTETPQGDDFDFNIDLPPPPHFRARPQAGWLRVDGRTAEVTTT